VPQVRISLHHRGVVGQSVLEGRGTSGEGREASSPLTPPSAQPAGFTRRADHVLHCEAVSLERLAEEVGTPFYVYSAASIRSQYGRLDAALRDVPHRIHYSLKANSSLGILRLLRELGSAADVVSGGELYRARRAGFPSTDIIFGGVGKTEAELAQAVEAGVLLVNAESEREVRLLDAIARARGRVAPIALRVNPEITVETPHSYTRTGEKGHKFGIPYDEAREVAAAVRRLPNVALLGLDMHIGSQLLRLDAYEHGAQRIVDLYGELRADGIDTIRYLDIGGGLAVTYDAEEPTDLEKYASIVVPLVRQTGLQLIVEPGRFLVGNAGALVTRVLYRKRSGGKELVITDAGMTELLRPSHYNAFHRIEAVAPAAPTMRLDVVGPVCESGDFLALDREVESVQPGDVLAVHSAGAYGFCMSSNYNSRPRVAEVLVDGGRHAVVTERERYEDLVRHEPLEPTWKGGSA
jgi:diaminopimelate decarboxylase